MQLIECVKCGSPFVLYVGKPGKINECDRCAVEVEILVAMPNSSDESGTDWCLEGRGFRDRWMAHYRQRRVPLYGGR